MACISPYYVRRNGDWLPCPCGRCPPCKKRRVDGWVFRCMEEEKRSISAHFVTLTYSPQFVPLSPNGFMTLDKTEFPRFMKRLRKLCVKGLTVKYYAAGEYGSKHKRPHYHAVVFNVPDKQLYFDAWAIDGKPIGDVHVADVSKNSIAYTMKYLDKRTDVGLHERDDREPEFALMSKGLGSNYITPGTIRYHNEDLTRNYLTVPGGHKIAMPRYYRDKILDDDAKAAANGHAEISGYKNESANYKRWERYYKDSGLTYDQYKERQRLAHLQRFYSHKNQSNRQ